MTSRFRTTLAASGVCALVALTAPLAAATTDATTPPPAPPIPAPGGNRIATGLEAPFGLQFTGESGLLVAENGTGSIVRVNAATGAKKTLITGLPGVASVGARNGKIYAVLGGPNEQGAPPPGKYKPASLLVADSDGKNVRVLADLLAYELKHNPDRQKQYVNGKPVETLANPFAMDVNARGIFVADGGANAVLRIDPATGRVSTFFVPPTVKTKPCLAAKVQANPGATGCDSVPTGVAYANGNIYVATLGSEVKNAARIYQLNASTGAVEKEWRGFTGLTGITVSPAGVIYASRVFEGAPAGDGPPPADFNPANVGHVVRIGTDGARTTAQVTMPTALRFREGRLYASAWSVAGFLGLQKAGQVVRVPLKSFK